MIARDSVARGLAWTALSFAAFVGALFAVLPLMAAAQLFAAVPHMAQMAAWSVIWGVLSIIGVLMAARIALGVWLAVGSLAWLAAATGTGLSATVHTVLQQWEIARFGHIDPDLVGLTAGLFAVLIGLATAAFGTLVAPSSVRGWPAAATLAGSLGVLWIVLLNLPGLDDGLSPESQPLAIWLGLSAIYALVVGATAVTRLARRSTR